MVRVLVVAGSEREAGEALSAVKGESVVLAYGKGSAEAGEISKYGVKVYRLDSSNPEVLFKAAQKLYEEVKPDLVLGVTSKNLRDALSRLAGIYDLPMATDVTEVTVDGGEVTYKRGILSAKAVATEKAPLPAVILLAPRKFKPGVLGEAAPTVEEVEAPGESKVSVVERKPKEKGGVNLEEAEIIVSVGRGFKKKEDLKLAFELAELLGAQIGCSRPIAADLQWLSEEHWVGLSGKKVAPKVYFAIGISGAPQHLAGIIDSKIVVAINKDKSAPIFKNADYGVVADLYKFLPVLIERIKARKGA